MARYVVKLSGEGLSGGTGLGTDPAVVDPIADSIGKAADAGHQLAIVVGGGNGQPFVTTDDPSVQRAVELGVDRLLVAKNGAAGVMTAARSARSSRRDRSSGVIAERGRPPPPRTRP